MQQEQRRRKKRRPFNRTAMIKVVQANLNHCRDAWDLLQQFVVEERVSVALLSDPYATRSPGWYADAAGLASVGVLSPGLTVGDLEVGVGFVSVTVGCDLRVYSCYAPPRWSDNEFEDFLGRLDGSVRSRATAVARVVVGGDFNAWSVSWGSRSSNRRGESLCAFADSLGLVVANRGGEPTFHGRGQGSVVDVTFASEAAASGVHDWTVRTDAENGSDHHYLTFSVGPSRTPVTREARGTADAPDGSTRHLGWHTAELDADTLAAGLLLAEWVDSSRPPESVPAADPSEEEADAVVRHATSACDFSLRRRVPNAARRPPVYWWNGEIAAARAECVRSRRAMTRCRGRGDADATVAAEGNLRTARAALKRLIRAAKGKCWDEMIQSVDADPWGKPYKLVMKKLRGPSATSRMEPQLLREVVTSLFPDRPPRPAGEDGQADDAGRGVPVGKEFSKAEVDAAVDRFRRRNRAPGPDGIPSRVWGVIHAARPAKLVSAFNSCLRSGTFPGRWKVARLALVPKPDKPEGLPSSYRPLCLLDDVGKVLEFLLVRRMEEHMAASGLGLSERQFGFRSGRSTDDALRVLHEKVVVACNARKMAVVVSLDIQNAFNTVGWDVITAALVRMRFPPYIRRIVGSYLSGRVLIVRDGQSGVAETVPVTCGVPQGSVLGPLLWNVAYDAVLRLPLPRGTITIGYADDTLVVAEGDSVEAAQNRTNAALATVSRGIGDLGLRLAVQKTAAVAFSNRVWSTSPRIRLGGEPVVLGESLKYLGILLERKGTLYGAHIRAAADKAQRVMTSLSRLMPNVGGPREQRRRLLVGVVHSVLLYGAPTWGPHLHDIPGAVAVMAAVQRRAALRSVCAYRTVSLDAAAVVASTVPIDLLAIERCEAFDAKRVADREAIGLAGTAAGDQLRPPALRPRTLTLARWSRRFQRLEAPEESGRAWTRTLIPPDALERWTSRTHGSMSFHLTQLFTGHGCFNRFLHRIGRAPSPGCSHCGFPDEENEVDDDALHTLMRCEAFDGERERLVQRVGTFDPGGLVSLMLESPDRWNAVAEFAGAVMSAKESAERWRQGQAAGEAVRPARRLAVGRRRRR